MESEGEYELQKLDLGHKFGLSQERLSFEVASARQEMEGRWDLEMRRVEVEIEQQRRLNEFRREQESQDQESGNQSRVGEARTRAAIAGMERESDMADMMELLNVSERNKDIKRRDEQERHTRVQLGAVRLIPVGGTVVARVVVQVAGVRQAWNRWGHG